MQKNEANNNDEEQKSRKNKYEFNLQRGRKICIDSDFDNGNIGLLRQVTEMQYRLQAISDYRLATPKKTWFHFRASAPRGIRLRFIIQNVSIYENMYEYLCCQVEEQNWAKPVMNEGQGWRQVRQCFLTYRGEVGIVIDYTFLVQNATVYFAMAVPHTYQQSQKYLKDLRYKIPDHVQYEDQIIAHSCGGLNLHLLRFTAKQVKEKSDHLSTGDIGNPTKCLNQIKGSQRVHSEANIENTIHILSNIKKPIIFITSRVHPGEVGSSHCLMGIIDFLLRPFNLQSYLILKMFQVLIIPIVNPDGVFEGNYRMDLNNNNLNRVYQDPSPEYHPTVYKIKQIITNLIVPTVNQKIDKILPNISSKIMFHFDLHSHSCVKSAFIYGNAFDQIVTQTESELYCKILQQNSQVFKYGLSHFGQKHMKMKDKGQALTKEGCARVVISKMANVVYSYTVQTAIFPYANKQSLLPAANTSFQLAENLYYDKIKSEQLSQRYEIKNQLVIDNMMLGYGLMISILDLLQKNPYSRLPNHQQALDTYRRQIAQNLIQSEQRFKQMDIKAYHKVKNIVKCCKQQFTSKHMKHWEYLLIDKQITTTKWPQCFKPFELSSLINSSQEGQKKKNRIKTQNSSDFQKGINDFINPKNVRKRFLNLQSQLIDFHNQKEEQQKKHEQISPSKTTISPRNIQIYVDVKPNPNGKGNPINLNSKSQSVSTHLPQIRSSSERIPIRNRSISQAQAKNGKREQNQCIMQLKEIKQMKQLKQSYQIRQMKQIKQLNQKQSTKNIVLSFIHQQMERINTMRKNMQKSMAVQNKINSFKLGKKASKSTKILQANTNKIVPNSNRYGQLNEESRKLLTKSEQIEENLIKKKIYEHVKEQQQRQYEEEEGIYYVKDENEQKCIQIKLDSLRHSQKVRNGKSLPKSRINVNKNGGSLQKIAEYPLYPLQKEKDKDQVGGIITSKRQLAKMKFSQLKRKNIIRQDLSNIIKLPQLRGINTVNSQNNKILVMNSTPIKSSEEEQKHDGNENKVNINFNVSVNVNVCIEGQSNKSTDRARAATMPDQI